MSTLFWKQWRLFTIGTIIVLILFSICFSHSINDWLLSLIIPLLTPFFVYNFYNSNKTNSDTKYCFSLFTTALIIRVVSVFIISEIFNHYNGMPFLSFKDDWNYNNSAMEIVTRWTNVGKIEFYDDIMFGTGTYSGYPNFSALCMLFFGKSYIVPRLVQSVFSAYSCILIYKICRTYTTNQQSRLVSSIAVFLPLSYVFSALQLKDTMLLFFTLVSLYGLVLSIKHISIKSLSLVLIGFIFIIFARPVTLVPFIASFFFIALFRKQKSILYVCSIICLAYIFFEIWDYFSTMGLLQDSDEYFEDRYSALMLSNYSDSGSRLANTSLATLVGAPLYLSLGLFLPAPLLVNLNDAETINYTAFLLVEHLTLLPFSVLGLLFLIKNIKNRAFIIPLTIVFIFLAFKIGLANSLQSILSPRQSIAPMTLMLFFIPFCPSLVTSRTKQKIILSLAIVISVIYTIVRLYSHSQL